MWLKNTTVETGSGTGTRHTLVVFVHGLSGGDESFQSAKEAIKERVSDHDVLAPSYPGSLISNIDPCLLAEKISACIDEAAGPYHKVVLIGYSLGALIARKAFVFARGQTQDSPFDLPGKARPWAAKVERIILLAGMNRGWSVDRRPGRTSALEWHGKRVLSFLGKTFGLGKLMLSAERGSPFVANLRIQWLNLERSAQPPEDAARDLGADRDRVEMPPPLPTTIQILGDEDAVVMPEDNTDVMVCRNFKFLKLPNTRHHDVLRFDDTDDGRRRKKRFLSAVLEPPDRIESDLIPDLTPPSEADEIVFVAHGIRDYGNEWMAELGRALERQAEAAGRKPEVITPSYGYLPLLGFLTSYLRLGIVSKLRRERNVRWFMDQYTEVIARCPKAECHRSDVPCRIHFVGHSNGTYLLARSLQDYKASRFGNIVLAGSVIRQDYGWDDLVLNRRVRAVRNHLASADWAVALFSRFFEEWSPRTSEVGSGGFAGFQQNEGRRYQVCYVRGGHGAALDPRLHDSIARFVLGLQPWPPDPPADPKVITKSQLPWLVTLSKFCVPVLFVGVFLVLVLGFAVASVAVYLLHEGWPVAREAMQWTLEGGAWWYRIWAPLIMLILAVRSFLKRY